MGWPRLVLWSPAKLRVGSRRKRKSNCWGGSPAWLGWKQRTRAAATSVIDGRPVIRRILGLRGDTWLLGRCKSGGWFQE